MRKTTETTSQRTGKVYSRRDVRRRSIDCAACLAVTVEAPDFSRGPGFLASSNEALQSCALALGCPALKRKGHSCDSFVTAIPCAARESGVAPLKTRIPHAITSP